MMSSLRTAAWRHAALVSSSKHLNPSVLCRHVASVTRLMLSSQANEQNSPDKSLVAMTLLVAGTIAVSSSQQKTDCCGIAGVVGAPSHDAR
jgi:hypothetical protein